MLCDGRELFRIAKQSAGEKRNNVGISCLKSETGAVKVCMIERKFGRSMMRSWMLKINVSDVSRVLLGRLVHTSTPWRSHHDWHWAGNCSKFVPQETLKVHSLTLSVLRLFVRPFPNCLSFYYETLRGWFLKNSYIWIKNLWELQSNLSWKDVANSTEGITQSNVNYLRHLMNESRQ